MMDNAARSAAISRMSGGGDEMPPDVGADMADESPSELPIDPSQVLPQVVMVLEALAKSNPEIAEKINSAVQILGETAGPKPPDVGEMGVDAEEYGEMPPV